MKIRYCPKGINNFHNSLGINLIITGETDKYGDSLYLISAIQNKRIEKHFCGMSSCGCPKGGAIQQNPEGTLFGIYKKYCKVL